MEAKEYFEKNRYVYLSDVLNKSDCSELVQHMFNLKEQGKLVKDDQCPKSWSVYGDPVLDHILNSLTGPLSKQLGINLIPTYTYARIYEPGEVLEKHRDRPSCEISGTMTLGFDESCPVWPIWFAKDADDPGEKFDIKTGDLVMYRGNELPHWRTAFKGKWQVQVFFHYVDAEGPHKDWAYDKRPPFGPAVNPEANIERKENQPKVIGGLLEDQLRVNWEPPNNSMIVIPQADLVPGYCSFRKEFKPELTFTKEECEKIIAIADNRYPQKAKVGSEAESQVSTKIRDVEEYAIEMNDSTRWIYEKLSAAITIANSEYYKYDIIGITHELQLLHYKSDEFQGHYDWHVDVGTGNAATRKISASLMLSPENSYEGGDLIINDHGNIINSCREQGSINMFPSYILHKVTPVTSGERWVLVIWINGVHRFR